ncbi:TetR/AcrR family transcriptional regulator [Polycladomyces subterraneus]|jgi:AcrR family transcriptional regulator|uniref:TetR/AcrR family transcriptional regulator n=1 Tax=Polycladomyces subterraneus TaxID=1016997 RepID=A0ABT8IKD8_9BACL|nr:TetR/AcrR family transcriptional regulator [Polycladomyces subterraneus]MDN4593185.1 TetR/AcrR family transcriptional regulator [Polycladomyces subterraneus]
MQPLLFTTEMPQHARDKILFAALQLFTSKGFQETSILEVVETARVSKTTFYNFFRNKEDLLVRLFEQLAEEILDEVKRAVREEKQATYKGFAGIRRYLQLCTERDSVARLLLITSAGVSGEIEAVRRKAHARFARLFQQTAREVMPQRVSEAEIQVVSKAMVGAINEVVIQRVADGSEEMDIDHLARLLNRIVVSSFTNLTEGRPITLR